MFPAGTHPVPNPAKVHLNRTQVRVNQRRGKSRADAGELLRKAAHPRRSRAKPANPLPLLVIATPQRVSRTRFFGYISGSSFKGALKWEF